MLGAIRPPTPSTEEAIIARLYRPVAEGPHIATIRQANGAWTVRSVYRVGNTPSVYDIAAWELDWRVRQTEDTRDAIDKRLAEAVYEWQTFADYIGA
jgi:hypothetical protein